jgi:hypothetical protein
MARNLVGAAGAAVAGTLVALAFFLTLGGAQQLGAQQAAASPPRAVAVGHGQPLAFEPNAGRFGRGLDYVVRDRGTTLGIAADSSVLAVGDGSALRTQLVGASAAARAHQARRLRGVVNWYVGSDRKSWRHGLPTFEGVRYSRVYPGIDVAYHGQQGQLEYDFLLAPHARASRINLVLSGAKSLRVAANGDLVARVGARTVTQLRPVAYQRIRGKKQLVRASFNLSGNRVAFKLGSYDRSRPLVIDPVLTYSDYFGGTGSDSAEDVAVDSGHNIIIGGTSSSPSIPGVSGGSPGGGVGMVAKLAADGTRQWATFLGWGVEGVAVDGSDNIVIAGYTNQASLTPTGGAQQTTFGGGANDGFVARLAPDGSRSWATYLGGSGTESAHAVAVDRSGAAYVVGRSNSSTSNISTAGAFQTTNAGGDDGFLVKYTPSGARSFGTYMGGSSSDEAQAVGVPPGCQSSCQAFVGGYSWGSFPTTAGTDRPTHSAFLQDGFIFRASATGGRSWATYTPLNQAASSSVKGLAVSPAGNPTVVGGAGQSNGTTRAFVSTFVAGTGLRGPSPGDYTYPTTGDGSAQDVAYDAQGNAYIIGETNSASMTTTFPVQSNYGGGTRDVFAIKASGSRAASLPVWATYLGGADSEYGNGIAADSDGGVYLVGSTSSNDFPMANSKQSASTFSEAFIARIDVNPPAIQSGPSGTSRSRDASFTYSSGEPGGSYRCRLAPAEADFTACPNNGRTYNGLADGPYTFEVQTVDLGGTPSRPATQAFTVDTQPVAAFSIAPNPVLAGRSVVFDASASIGGDGPIVKYEWDLDGDGTFERDTGTTATTSQVYSAAQKVPIGLRITNAAGVSGTTAADLQVSNLTGVSQFGVTINKGAQFTRTPNVTVTANFPTTTTSLLFSNDGGFLNPTTFQPAQSIKWKLDSSGPERLPKTIYVRFLNGPLVSETHQDDIILDETPPTVQQADLAAASAAASGSATAARLKKWRVKVKATDRNSGVAKVQLAVKKKKPLKAVKYKRRLTVKSKTRPAWLRAQDRAGNWSKWRKTRRR